MIKRIPFCLLGWVRWHCPYNTTREGYWGHVCHLWRSGGCAAYSNYWWAEFSHFLFWYLDFFRQQLCKFLQEWEEERTDTGKAGGSGSQETRWEYHTLWAKSAAQCDRTWPWWWTLEKLKSIFCFLIQVCEGTATMKSNRTGWRDEGILSLFYLTHYDHHLFFKFYLSMTLLL